MISKARRTRDVCGTGGKPATPAQMYASRFRIAVVSGAFVRRAIEQTNGLERPLSINTEGLEEGCDYRHDGHIDIINCRYHARTFRKNADVLSISDTISNR